MVLFLNLILVVLQGRTVHGSFCGSYLLSRDQHYKATQDDHVGNPDCRNSDSHHHVCGVDKELLQWQPLQRYVTLLMNSKVTLF